MERVSNAVPESLQLAATLVQLRRDASAQGPKSVTPPAVPRSHCGDAELEGKVCAPRIRVQRARQPAARR